MNHKNLKKLITTNEQIRKYIYISNFFFQRPEIMKEVRITIINNMLRKYSFIEWLDYEYGKYKYQNSFNNKDGAANCAYEIYLKGQNGWAVSYKK